MAIYIGTGIKSDDFPVSINVLTFLAYTPTWTQNAVHKKLLIDVTVKYCGVVTANTPTT